MKSSRLSLRIYPAGKSSLLAVLGENIRYAPIAIALLVLINIFWARLSWWALTPALLGILAIHVYLTTDLMLSDERRAEVMGYGLDRRGDRLLYSGFAPGRNLSHRAFAPIAHIEMIGGESRVHLVGGRIVPLSFLGDAARQRFADVYKALKEGASRSDLVDIYPDFMPGIDGLRWTEGVPRVSKRWENIVSILIVGIELTVSFAIANALR